MKREYVIYSILAAVLFIVLYQLMTDQFNLFDHNIVGTKPGDPPSDNDGEARKEEE